MPAGMWAVYPSLPANDTRNVGGLSSFPTDADGNVGGLSPPILGYLVPHTGLLAFNIGFLAFYTGLLASNTGLLASYTGLRASNTGLAAPPGLCGQDFRHMPTGIGHMNWVIGLVNRLTPYYGLAPKRALEEGIGAKLVGLFYGWAHSIPRPPAARKVNVRLGPRPFRRLAGQWLSVRPFHNPRRFGGATWDRGGASPSPPGAPPGPVTAFPCPNTSPPSSGNRPARGNSACFAGHGPTPKTRTRNMTNISRFRFSLRLTHFKIFRI